MNANGYYYNNTGNNGGLTILLLLIILSIMLSLSSSSAYMAYDLVSTVVKASPEVVAYEKGLDEKTDLKAKQINLDGEQIRKDIRDEYRKT